MTMGVRMNMDERDICSVRLEVGGARPPHEWTLTVVGFCREQLDDRVMRIVRNHGDEFAPFIAQAFRDVILKRLAENTDIADFDI